MDYWFGMGVDGMRLDAVPYLVEREGTSCENLPETHAFLKELRAHIDEHFEGRMLAGRGQPVAGRRGQLFWQRRRMSYGLPFSADAAAVHRRANGRPFSDRRNIGRHAGDSRRLSVDAFLAQSRRVDAGNGHRRRARLHVSGVCSRSPSPNQSWHPPPPRAADAKQPPDDRIAQRSIAFRSPARR